MEIATKEDIAAFKKEILDAINAKQTEKYIPPIVQTCKAKELLGDVSDGFLKELRLKGVLNPAKVGGLWLWNLDEILNILPKSPQNLKA